MTKIDLAKHISIIRANKQLDSGNMFDVIKNFPNQVSEAIEIGKSAPLFKNYKKPADFLIAGMGGSAIGGDLLRSYCSITDGAKHLIINVNRYYGLLHPINSDTFFIASSYSGNTEETISAFYEGIKSTKNMLCIASGGELERIALENDVPVIKIPAGFMPRAALGYSFFPLLYILMRTGAFEDKAIKETESAIEETLTNLATLSAKYSQIDEQNEAIGIASAVHGKVPIIYTSIAGYDSVNLRWRCQIQENAKNAAFGNLLPEMNHNEINAFDFPKFIKDNCIVFLLKERDELSKIESRFIALKQILEEQNIEVIEYVSSGKHKLARMFDAVYTGDWVSFYLSMLNGIDPTPIPIITKLKNYIQVSLGEKL